MLLPPLLAALPDDVPLRPLAALVPLSELPGVLRDAPAVPLLLDPLPPDEIRAFASTKSPLSEPRDAPCEPVLPVLPLVPAPPVDPLAVDPLAVDPLAVEPPALLLAPPVDPDVEPMPDICIKHPVAVTSPRSPLLPLCPAPAVPDCACPNAVLAHIASIAAPLHMKRFFMLPPLHR